MLTKFGIWEIDEDFGIIGKVNPIYDYNITKESLWKTRKFQDLYVWEWLIHLTEKTWITIENYNDFVTAFTFAQDFFKDYKPKDNVYISIANSIYIGQQFVLLNHNKDNQKDFEANGSNGYTLEDILYYKNKISEIKSLDLI
jgi:hypothetical protein